MKNRARRDCPHWESRAVCQILSGVPICTEKAVCGFYPPTAEERKLKARKRREIQLEEIRSAAEEREQLKMESLEHPDIERICRTGYGSKELEAPRCPVCGCETDTFYINTNDVVCGCDQCITTRVAWDEID